MSSDEPTKAGELGAFGRALRASYIPLDIVQHVPRETFGPHVPLSSLLERLDPEREPPQGDAFARVMADVRVIDRADLTHAALLPNGGIGIGYIERAAHIERREITVRIAAERPREQQPPPTPAKPQPAPSRQPQQPRPQRSDPRHTPGPGRGAPEPQRPDPARKVQPR